MKKTILAGLLFITLDAAAQTKNDTTHNHGTRIPVVDSVIQPTNSTPLLTYQDVAYLRDSVLANAPYKYAPALNQVFGWLEQQIAVRAREFVDKQKKRR